MHSVEWPNEVFTTFEDTLFFSSQTEAHQLLQKLCQDHLNGIEI